MFKALRSRRLLLGLIAVLTALFVAGSLWANAPILRMATTTSTDNTGLLDYLAPLFKAETGIELQWVSVGTGKALELGKNGDVDVLLVHAPSAELQFVEAGHLVNRRQVMYNDFVVIGPASDPAGIKGKTVAEAMKAIAEKKALFVSRADKSGTHVAELALWEEAGMPVPDKEQWYVQAGQGMLPTINMAGERDGYTLTDRGTFIKYEDNHDGNPPLVILVEGDAALRNQYSVLAVNPANHSHIAYDLALKYIDWMVKPETQKAIGEFKLMNKQLFFPNAGR
jgi:tungstate transport system substrate-binding protein